MSVIFKTLKRLEQQSFGEPGRPPKNARRNRPGFLRRFSGTPLAMGLLLFSIFAAGGGLLFGLNRLSEPHRTILATHEDTPSNRAGEATRQQVETQEKQVQTAQGAANHDPSAPSKAPLTTEEVVPDTSNAVFTSPFAADGSSAGAAVQAAVQFSPPTDAAAAAGEKNAAMDGGIKIEASHGMAGEENRIVATGGETAPSQGRDFNFTGLDHPLSEIEDAPPPRWQREAASVQGAGETIQGKAAERKTSVPITKALTPEQQKRLVNYDKLQQAARKRAVISELVTDLEAALEQMDEPKVASMLDRLTAVKGQENIFVLNLRAFWCLKQERYDQAEALLLKVLAVNPDHLEAGINLAIVESRTERQPLALKRLMRLKEHYPENSTLADMIRKLQ